MNNTYSDYEKIIPSEKLPQFLFDFFDRFKEVTWVKNNEEKLFYQSLQFNIDKYSKNKFLVRFLDKIFSKLYSKKNLFLSFQKNKKKILFRPFKYYNIILGAKKYHQVGLINHGNWDRFFAVKNFMGYIVTSDLDHYVLVWGKYFTDLYQKQNVRKSEDIYVLGYPYLIEKNQDIEKKDKNYIVYYLGTNLEFYNEEFLNVKLEAIKKINEICNKLGMKFFYRSHPGENRELLERNLIDIAFTDKKEGLQEAFKKADIFISFQSTSLVEATMSSKVSLQLMNYPLKSDNFETLGACSKSLQTIEELEDYLSKIARAQTLDALKTKLNNDYIETRYNPIERFLEIIKEI